MKLDPVFLVAIAGAALAAGCSSNADSPGLEYMPDMYRSPAIEAYVDYGQDPYYFGDSLARAQRATSSARLPVEGTIPFADQEADAAFNFPFPYPNTPEGYDQAGKEAHSPIPMTEATVEQGKKIYDVFCIQCHGAKGQGDGTVVAKGNYPPPPAYDGNQLKNLPEGQIFHAITYGRNIAMGSHASQLNHKERWLVVQYVKYLQNGGKMPGEQTAMETAAATAQAQ
ncbi:MAG TPA: cytochrome c [Flavobacteriales bacterium]|nr:c-type cytochrome [Flavobacteriales bacterium]HRN36493.1 cytochrome c [Flavobacteriales bacterium]HRO38378.1 cytochrome c [Flavobacteriales bacterium]HRP80385.1 cytochrome c [Flavobacteriales bacterium]HRQ83568.1 cytochrome c [Flavobacteriales bacterium]